MGGYQEKETVFSKTQYSKQQSVYQWADFTIL